MHWRGIWQPTPCSCLENPRDRGAWWAAVYGVSQSRTQLKWLSSSSVFLPPLLNLFCSLRSLMFLSFMVPILGWNIPLISPVFLGRSLDFPILLFFSVFLHCLLKPPFFLILAILWHSVFSWIYFSLSTLPFASNMIICKRDFIGFKTKTCLNQSKVLENWVLAAYM